MKVRELRDHRGIIFASLYTIIKNKTGDIFLSGQNQCHVTGVKCLIFVLPFIWDQKNFSGGGWKVTLVSVCVHFLTFRHTDTRHKMDTFLTHRHKMDTELDKNLFLGNIFCDNYLNAARVLGSFIHFYLHFCYVWDLFVK